MMNGFEMENALFQLETNSYVWFSKDDISLSK